MLDVRLKKMFEYMSHETENSKSPDDYKKIHVLDTKQEEKRRFE